MAHRELKEKVLTMRREGMSYSQIQTEVKVSKGRLSEWLKDLPLSKERINKLRAQSPQRIEKCRNTKAKKKQERLDKVYRVAENSIGVLSKREIFLCGVSLFWGEGSKTRETSLEITNTDPAMIKFAMTWFQILGINKRDIIVSLKIYKDMSSKDIILFWKNELKVKDSQFRLSIKNSNQSTLTYKTGYGYGTCTLRYWNRDIYEYIMQSLRYFKTRFL